MNWGTRVSVDSLSDDLAGLCPCGSGKQCGECCLHPFAARSSVQAVAAEEVRGGTTSPGYAVALRFRRSVGADAPKRLDPASSPEQDRGAIELDHVDLQTPWMSMSQLVRIRNQNLFAAGIARHERRTS